MRNFGVVLLCLVMLSCARAEASRQPVEVEMRNVDLHVTADIASELPATIVASIASTAPACRVSSARR